MTASQLDSPQVSELQALVEQLRKQLSDSRARIKLMSKGGGGGVGAVPEEDDVEASEIELSQAVRSIAAPMSADVVSIASEYAVTDDDAGACGWLLGLAWLLGVSFVWFGLIGGSMQAPRC